MGNDHGEPFGTVTLTYERKDRTLWFEAAFAFDDGETASYEGKAPGRGSGKGREKLKLRQRTGRRPRKDGIEVVSWNPRRWG